ncbi:MAG: alpha/beta fold hydrolase [Gemmatimonadota bacterium]
MRTRRREGRGTVAAWVALVLPLLAPAPADAQSPPVIPLEHFFDNPEVAGAQISPDGKWLSYLKPYEGKLNIHVRAIGSRDGRTMTADTVRPVTGYFWSADASLLLYVQDKGGNENFHVYAVPLAGTGTPQARDLTPFEGVRAVIFDVPRELPDRIFIGLNRRDPSVFDAYWLNLESGELTLVVENPGRHIGYLLDAEHDVRAALGQNARGGTEIYVPGSAPGEWRTVASYPPEENVNPVRLHPDGRRLYLSSNHGEADLAGLVLLDLETGEESVLERDPEGAVDLGGAVFSDSTDELVATVYIADTARIYPKTPEIARDLERRRRLQRGTPSFTSMTRDETKAVVTFNSDVDPGATYLYDRKTGKTEFLFRPRPWLKPQQLVEMKPISFKARDGLVVHGYLTLPKGVRPRGLPMVLVVHGGPWARDTWGYDAEAQLLANRGYAVLQVNYRGSTGYGKAFYNAAVREWAGTMHTDLIDGVRWAVAEGIADPKRVGIYGGSYGGYATLVGLTFTPEVFACGVDYVGPSSLITLIESFPSYWRPFLEGSFYRHVGDPAKDEDREEMKKRSPLFFVDRIEDPLLIVQGANDPRVTKREADQMAIALRDRGIKVRYLLAENEGHGFLNPDNRLALYRSMEIFFGDCLGGRRQASVSAAIETRMAQLTVDVDALTLTAKTDAPEVRPGDTAVDASHLRPARETKRLVLAQGGNEREIGTAMESIEAIETKQGPAFRYVQVLESPALGGTQTDTVVVGRETLAPVSHRSRNARRTLALDYAPGAVSGSVTPAGGAAEPIQSSLDAPAFDGGTLDLVLRSLPLKEGFAAQVPIYLHEAGGTVLAEAHVKGAEPAQAGEDASVDCWVVEAQLAGQTLTFWIAKESRALVKQVLTAAPGVEIRIVR